MQGLGRVQGALELEDVRSIGFCSSFSQALTRALEQLWAAPTLTLPPSTALPTERKRHRFCLILKRSHAVLVAFGFQYTSGLGTLVKLLAAAVPCAALVRTVKWTPNPFLPPAILLGESSF